MANHCYNSASIEGSKQMLDKFEKALAKAKKEDRALFNATFYKVLGQEPIEEDVYNNFGSRWFEATWERQSPTSGILSGDSAWSPINEFLLQLSSVYGLTIASTYEETGDDFGGWYYCQNGIVLRDETTSYYAFRYMDDREHTLQSMIEDASEGYWESADEICPELLEIMRSKDKAELIEAVEQSILDRA